MTSPELQHGRSIRRSRLRRWGAGALLVLILGGAYAYFHFTRPQQLIRFAEGYLSSLTQGRVQIQDGSFSLFDGIRLHRVTVSVSAKTEDLVDEAFKRKAVFECETLSLKHDPLALLAGRLEATDVIATGARFTLIADSQTGRLNVAELFTGTDEIVSEPPSTGGSPRTNWPRIRLPDARFFFYKLKDSQMHLEQESRLDLWAIQRRVGEPLYQIGWRDRQVQEAAGRAKLNLITGAMEFEPGSQPPWLPVELAFAAMPISNKTYERWIRLLGIEGDFRVEELAFGEKVGPLRARGRILLKGASLSVPMDADEERLPAQERFFVCKDVEGFIEVTASRVRAVFRGDLRGRKCRTELQVNDIPSGARHLTEASWELTITSDDFLMLRNDPRHFPYEARAIQKWPLLQRVYRDLDPHGRVKLICKLAKPPGRAAEPHLVKATFEALGGDGRYRPFPYRLYDVTGTVDIEEGGRIVIKNLVGRHSTSHVVINGTVAGYSGASAADLNLVVRNISLNRDLYVALPPTYQEFWDMFALSGLANMRVQVTRPQGVPGTYSPIKTVISGELLDGQVCYVGFPYRIENLKGRFEIDKGLEMDLRGSSADAAFSICGFSKTSEQGDPIIDLDIRGWYVPIDDRLRQAFSTGQQKTFDSFSPLGQFDVAGKVYRHAGMAEASYIFDAALADAAITYDKLPYTLTGCKAKMHFEPDRITVNDFSGEHGSAIVTGRAEFELDPDLPQTVVEFSAKNVKLDESLLSCLSNDVQRIYRQLAPEGAVDLRAEYRESEAGGRGDASFKTVVNALGNTITYEALPLPLSQLQGQMVISEHNIELVGLSARYGDAVVQVDGQVNYESGETTADLRLNIRNMPFSLALHDALPPRWKKLWSEIRPTGRFDLNLDRLHITAAETTPLHWELGGELVLLGADLEVGFELRDVNGSLILHGDSGEGQDQMLMAADLAIDSAKLSGARLTDLTGHCVYDEGVGLLALRGLKAQAYGGQAAGSVMVTLAEEQPRYDVICEFTGVPLEPFLKDRGEDSREPHSDIKGKVSATLAVEGTFGQVEVREGWGRLVIEKAQMYKLPLVLAILDVSRLTAPERGAFQNCRFDYLIQGDKMLLNDILLRGNAFALAGTGTMSLADDHLDLDLVVVSPHRRKIPVLTSLFEDASRELVEVRVQGPLEAPEITTRSLQSLSKAIKNILEPKGQD